MAGEFCHSSVGTALSQAEWESITAHSASGETQGDVIYFNGTNWVRLGAGTNGKFLMTQGTSANPAWARAGRTAMFTVAASNATSDLLDQADYVCDGTADEVQINQALATAATYGGTVVLSDGLFTIANSITMGVYPVSLIGQGIESTYIRRAVGNDNTGINAGNGVASLYGGSIQRLTLSGNRGASAAGKGIDVNKSYNFTIREVRVNAWNDVGIELEGSGGQNFITNCAISDCNSHGLYLVSGNAYIIGNSIDSCSSVSGDTAAGIQIQGGEFVIIGNNIFNTSGYFIRANAVSDGLIQGNHCNGTGRDGFLIDGASHDINIIGNNVEALGTATNNTYAGISVAGATYCIIVGNRIRKISNTNIHRYGILDGGTNNRIFCNDIQDAVTSPISGETTGNCRLNGGYVQENGGSATITSGSTLVSVDHGLSVTPSAGNITVTPTANCTNPPGLIYVPSTGITSTGFQVRCAADPGASGLAFIWQAVKL